MLQVTVTTVSAPLTIISKDLSAGATFNADVTPGQGKLRAGTFMTYDAAAQTLTKSAAGAAIFGLLADDYDDTNVGGQVIPAMVYRQGVFLRQEIESANNLAIVPGEAIDDDLRSLGIYLELSYDTYVGLEPVPPGVQPMPMQTQAELEAEGVVLGRGANPATTVGPTTQPTSPSPTSTTTTPNP